MRKQLLLYVGSVLILASSAVAAIESGVYQVSPGATVEERGDRVPNGKRIMPLSARVIFDLRSAPPSLTAFLTNAVLEGSNAFPLTVRSSSSYQPSNGTYTFSGDYLRDMYPSGTQYLFNWRFSPSTNGELLWNGYITWAGGHLWDVTISNVTLVPQPWLTISRTGSASVQIAWSTNFPDHGLQYATGLPGGIWSPVTDAVSSVGGRFSVTVDIDASNRFYRLRKP